MPWSLPGQHAEPEDSVAPDEATPWHCGTSISVPASAVSASGDGLLCSYVNHAKGLHQFPSIQQSLNGLVKNLSYPATGSIESEASCHFSD